MATTVSAALGRRLEALTGTSIDACVRRLQGAAKAAKRGPGFAEAHRLHLALADERRLLAVALLRREGELCGCELQAALGVSHATVSHHMEQLLQAGLVTAERRGKWVHYQLTKAGAAHAP